MENRVEVENVGGRRRPSQNAQVLDVVRGEERNINIKEASKQQSHTYSRRVGGAGHRHVGAA